ncbi:MAG: amine oxidase [Rhodospirillales bacterium]|nr:amine oxidase [Rhodospirillales bacterium]
MADGIAYDVAIIGAGAAGIAAGRCLVEAGLRIVILEARDRIGGRSHTVATEAGPVDLGCEWLHSADRNPLTAIAQGFGLALDERLPDWGGRLRRLGASAAEEADWYRARDAFHDRLEEAGAAATEDAAASTLLSPGGKWNPLLDAISTWANGAELARVSIKDYAAYQDSGVNWRVRDGYGMLVARLGTGLPVALGNPVAQIDHRGRMIRVEAAQGTVEARAVLLTVPSTLVAAETIRFTPRLPDDKLAAANGIPLGLANKLFLALDGTPPDLPPNSHVLGARDRVATGSYELRPHGRPIVAAYFGGNLARELELAGPSAMASFAIDELVSIFGTGLRAQLRALASSAWHGDEFARGSYSHALPGHAGDRATLARPIGDRVFFAGEACIPGDFSTAHGAYRSGREAADAIIGALDRKRIKR